jgi:lysophospholipase L1-like esterase
VRAPPSQEGEDVITEGLTRGIVAALVTATLACVATTSAHAATDGGLLSILVMGDSYSAGNGAGDYYGAKGCRRSARNYGREFQRRVEAAPHHQRAFVETVACSGDTTEEFFRSKHKRPTQISHVNAGYDLIFLTIGGNDLQFADIVKFCLIASTRDGAN